MIGCIKHRDPAHDSVKGSEQETEQLQRETNKQPKTHSQVSSMRALVVLPLLLCVGVCVHQARAEVKAVKLCGREFLRAVVYTCGGSRWRRFFSDPEMDGLPIGEQNSLEGLSTPGSEWSKRDINNAVTNMCCQVGCRKSDLAYLC